MQTGSPAFRRSISCLLLILASVPAPMQAAEPASRLLQPESTPSLATRRTLPATLGAREQPLPAVEAFAPSVVRVSDTRLRISFDITHGYYLYRKHLAVSAGGHDLALIDLPAGQATEDEFVGQAEIYRQSLVFEAEAELDVVLVTLAFQGCAEDRFCYPVNTHTVNLAGTLPGQ